MIFQLSKLDPKSKTIKLFQREPMSALSEVINRTELKVRVWERGCGETLACGTGTCAAVAVANKLGKVGDKVTVHVLGGDLQVEVAETLVFERSC